MESKHAKGRMYRSTTEIRVLRHGDQSTAHLMPLVQVEHPRPGAMPARGVHRALLGAYEEVVHVVLGEAEAGGSHRLALLVLQLQRLLGTGVTL